MRTFEKQRGICKFYITESDKPAFNADKEIDFLLHIRWLFVLLAVFFLSFFRTEPHNENAHVMDPFLTPRVFTSTKFPLLFSVHLQSD